LSGAVRRCSRCRLHLPLELFNRNGADRQWYCRRCFRTYFSQRRERHLGQVAAARIYRRDAARRFITEHLRRTSCMDCGEPDPVVLEFDHLRDKHAEVTELVRNGASIAAVEAEIAKCDVVCVNCHRHRTAARGAWRRAAKPWWSAPAPQPAPVARNLAVAYSLLETRGCVDCRTKDLVVLEFDHIGEKRAAVTRLAWDGVAHAVLLAEIAQCLVRCASCHRRVTAARGRHYRHAQA
jgi:hypothetical protein